jgi:hypothetical protein
MTQQKRNKRKTPRLQKLNSYTPVVWYNMEGKELGRYMSVKIASRITTKKVELIRNCCNGKVRKVFIKGKPYIFKYLK